MFEREYDFIVIGGGSAGCLLARRLVESNCGTVALIEAGDSGDVGKVDARTVVPAYYPKTFGSRLDWVFSTELQTGLNGRRIAWPRGKTLGGSGAINALIYIQAAASDFDRWAESGCIGWDWQSVEKNLLTTLTSHALCPVSGLQLSEITEPHAWSHAFIDACAAYGLQRKKHWLQAERDACGYYSLTQHNGRRQHTGQQLAETLPNTKIDVFRGVTVQDLKVIHDRVEKVRIVDNSNRVTELRVSGEVILCAGTIGSPSILLRSGVGPASLLRGLGINVTHDLPGVGENLQDHLMYPLIYRTHASDGLPARFSVADRQRFRHQEPGSAHGPLASNIAEAGATFGQCTSPDFQIHFTPTHYLKYPSRNAPMNCFSLAVTDLHPRSRGRLQLVSTDPNDAPRIDPGYLQHAEDGSRLLSGIETCREIANQSSLSTLVADEIMPGRKRSDASAILRSVQMFAQSIYHPVGTCRMGMDSQAVVDSELRVHGFRNLHVADASVLPDLPSANTQAVTLLVAARKFDWLSR